MKQSLKTLITAVLAFALSCTVLFWLNPANAAEYATDCNDNGISEQISAEAIAKAEWIEENGEWQPNLDADTEKYLRKTTALLQEQRNAKSKTR
ncbi:hypothetical protein NJ8700_02205 [Aggregatibacter aphrophilus NJ8700]|jgi:putative lipoprotein|uniref:Uncharacterized protein n=1 Tax=Aggregatibacter aphrophilus (strain NJ8700) TaxID=634176 RepID=C6AM26_AGGAN|nr:hypothetical protein [Aggregatibacter aphrophilus]ABW02833.1 hypothetical protein Hap62p13 [Aggregatibacter aphrophilus NJ8700]ACS96888.1 lipoprotein, putative [Aggregatibacter aphrophilus NJ8700]AKS64265.1 hypothetical protein NJ8700_02205 [Aggregatibacter aphrophilus NJ8700]